MDTASVLAAFDAEVRHDPREAGGAVEREGAVVRVVGEHWSGVLWSALDAASADTAIAAQIERFAHHGGRWEWKLFSYDRPGDLPERLTAAGLRPGEQESLLVAEIAELRIDAEPPAGVELVAVADEAAVLALVRLQAQVFGDEDGDAMAAPLLDAISRRPPHAAAVLGLADGEPVAGGRVDLPPGRRFAGLFGGVTREDHRRRGIFAAVVAHRAAAAAARGHRWLYVDALETSRPILERLGFVELAKTTPYVPHSD